MKLNPDCLRQLLLTIEKFPTINEDLSYQHFSLDDVLQEMPEYSKSDIAYTTIKAIEAEMINAHVSNFDNMVYSCIYSSLTYKGHKFLENIKDDTVWSKTKQTAKKLGSFSITILIKAAEKILIDLLDKQP